MKLSHSEVYKLEQVLTMYESGQSNAAIARFLGDGTKTGEGKVSTFFHMLRKMDINPVRNTDVKTVKMTDQDIAEWNEYMRQRDLGMRPTLIPGRK